MVRNDVTKNGGLTKFDNSMVRFSRESIMRLLFNITFKSVVRYIYSDISFSRTLNTERVPYCTIWKPLALREIKLQQLLYRLPLRPNLAYPSYCQGHKGFPVKNIVDDVVDIESVTEAVRTGPYGRCVYDCDNNVVSHQVVNFQFDDGATACFNMVAFTEQQCLREVKVYGTKGEISFEDGWEAVQVFDFLDKNTYYHKLVNDHPDVMDGHRGADYQMMKSFVKIMQGKGDQLVTGPEETLNSHLLVFAAEKARLENMMVTINSDDTF